MTYSIEEQGEPVAIVSFDDLKVLAPLTSDPDKILKALGINDSRLKDVLVKLSRLSNFR